MLMPSYRRGLQQADPSPHYNPDMARQNAMKTYLTGQNQVAENDYNPPVRPEYDWAVKALEQGADTAQLNLQSAMNAASNAAQQAAYNMQQQLVNQQNAFNSQFPTGVVPTGGGATGGTAGQGGGNPTLRAVLNALSSQESGGNYGAVNADSGAMGRWQVMPANIAGSGGWDMEALGRNISTSDFLNNPRLQNQIVRYKFGQYLQKYGLKGALSAWYSGDPNKWNSKDSQGNYPSVYNYVMQVLDKLGY